MDLTSTITHPWHYAALVHDMLGIKKNKVKLKEKPTDPKLSVCDLDPQRDYFWAAKLNAIFPEILTDVTNELSQWTLDHEKMGHKKPLADNIENILTNLSDAMDMLPEMTRKKQMYFFSIP